MARTHCPVYPLKAGWPVAAWFFHCGAYRSGQFLGASAAATFWEL